MKTNILSLLALTGLLTFTSCASDDTANKDNNQEPGTEGLTSFVEEGNSTRTTAEYDGSGLNFYWTAGDRLWVNTGTTTSPVLTQDSQNNINSTLVNNPTNPSAVKRVDKAKFYFAGTFTASSYPVRYTGKNGAKDKVTIKAAQSQTIPNDASHIGEDGDFGVATATKPVGSGKYHFTLDHKAAYITFMPYTTQTWGPNAVIQKIRIFTGNTSDALAGTFDLADDGTLSNPASTSNSVELDVSGGFWNGGFSIPSTETYATNGATMVVNPGTYNDVSIEYTLHDPVVHVTGTIIKTYASLTFTAGKNKKVKTDLQVRVYPGDGYYMWDAQQHYWYGHESSQPKLGSQGIPSDNSWPQSQAADPLRWYNDVAFPTAASLSAKDCPNVNEVCWYVRYGDARWDNSTLWATMEHLYIGGVWLKKQSTIVADNPSLVSSIQDLKDKAPDGLDYTTLATMAKYAGSVSQTPPSDYSKYFFLPALGDYSWGGFHSVPGDNGFYWVSTSLPGYVNNGYRLYFYDGGINMYDWSQRYRGFRIWKADDSDNQYRPLGM